MAQDLSPNDFARLAQLHPETVRRLARQKKLPGFYRIGRVWRISAEQADRLRAVRGLGEGR